MKMLCAMMLKINNNAIYKLHATTQDIADAAGISRTSLHYYFRSRDELMKQVFNEAMGELNGKRIS